jgi:hypothetical protein
VVVVVDIGEVAQLRRGQLIFSCQEPHPAGLGTQPGETVGQQRSVSGLDLPYPHLRPVAQHDPLTLRRRSLPVTGQVVPAGPQPAGDPAERRSGGNGRAGRDTVGRLGGV